MARWKPFWRRPGPLPPVVETVTPKPAEQPPLGQPRKLEDMKFWGGPLDGIHVRVATADDACRQIQGLFMAVVIEEICVVLGYVSQMVDKTVDHYRYCPTHQWWEVAPRGRNPMGDA